MGEGWYVIFDENQANYDEVIPDYVETFFIVQGLGFSSTTNLIS